MLLTASVVAPLRLDEIPPPPVVSLRVAAADDDPSSVAMFCLREPNGFVVRFLSLSWRIVERWFLSGELETLTPI